MNYIQYLKGKYVSPRFAQPTNRLDRIMGFLGMLFFGWWFFTIVEIAKRLPRAIRRVAKKVARRMDRLVPRRPATRITTWVLANKLMTAAIVSTIGGGYVYWDIFAHKDNFNRYLLVLWLVVAIPTCICVMLNDDRHEDAERTKREHS